MSIYIERKFLGFVSSKLEQYKQKNTDLYNFRCPYCGDSQDNPRKKRGNVYWNDLYYHCYNCSVHLPLTKFLSDYEIDLDLKDKITVINFIENTKKNFSYGEGLNFYLFEV